MQGKAVVILLLAAFCAVPSVGQKSASQKSSKDSTPTGPEAQDLEAVVFPITDLKVGLGVEIKNGTGFCLDSTCRFVGTNYHVAMLAQPRKIKGQKIVQRYLATGPDDEGGTVNDGPSMPAMKYTLSRDLAIFELQYPLRHHHGLSFYRKDLRIGQEVEIFSYPKELMLGPRKLLHVHGKFKGQTQTGLLAFDYALSDGRAIRPGASGGIVVDRATQQIVGVLSGIAESGEAIALAVPVDSVEQFVSRVQPYLAQAIFPSNKKISPFSEDMYPRFVWPSTVSLQPRPEESIEVQTLRSNAQFLADGMRDLIAVQSYSWGSQDHEPVVVAKYEVRILEGRQHFRELPDGKKELQHVPLPPLNNSITDSAEWSELPVSLGTNLNLKIHQAADVAVNGRAIKIFQYQASLEDRVCTFKSVTSFGLFTVGKTVFTACYGEAWTDENMNILRISEHLEFLGGWKNPQVVVTYGRLRKADDTPRDVPFTIVAQGEYKKKTYWCRGQFTDYQLFTSRARVVASANGTGERTAADEKRR